MLMQKLNERNILRELSAILPDGGNRERMLSGYREVNGRLGEPGASERFAEMMIKELADFRF